MAKKKVYKKEFFIKMNMQNPPKPKPMDWYVRVADETSIPENTVCGYEFTEDLRDDSFGIAEGNNPKFNFRKAFLPEKGHYWLSRDFAGQELRIVANLAMEPVWIDTFLNGGDVHGATAATIWGKDKATEKRKAAKAINFGLIYGVSSKSLGEQLKISEEEAQSYIDAFFKNLPNIKRLLDRFARQAQKTREIANVYGRKRRLHIFVNEYGNLSGAGRRRAYNSPIQSAGAEITKLALIKIYKTIISNEKYKGKVYFMNTIHDEINLSVEKSIIEEMAYKVGETMTHKMPGMPVPIITDLEIGNSMGLAWKFDQDPETLKLTPRLKEKISLED